LILKNFLLFTLLASILCVSLRTHQTPGDYKFEIVAEQSTPLPPGDLESLVTLENLYIGSAADRRLVLSSFDFDGATKFNWTMTEDTNQLPSIHKAFFSYHSDIKDFDDKYDLGRLHGLSAHCSGDSLLKNFRFKFDKSHNRVWWDYDCIKTDYDYTKCTDSRTPQVSLSVKGTKIFQSLPIPFTKERGIKKIAIHSTDGNILLSYTTCEIFTDTKLLKYLMTYDATFFEAEKRVTIVNDKPIFAKHYYQFFYTFSSKHFSEDGAGKEYSKETAKGDVEMLTSFIWQTEQNWSQNKTNALPISFQTETVTKDTVKGVTGFTLPESTNNSIRKADRSEPFDLEFLINMKMSCKQEFGGMRRTRAVMIRSKFSTKEKSFFNCVTLNGRTRNCNYKEAYLIKETKMEGNSIVFVKKFELQVKPGMGIGEIQLYKKDNGAVVFGYDECNVKGKEEPEKHKKPK